MTGRDDVGPPWVVALGTYGDAIIRLGADYNFCDLDLAFLSEAIDLATGQEVSFVQLVNLNPDHFPMRLRLADRDYAFVLADGGTLRVADARLAWADDADFTCEASAIVEYIDGPG